MVLVNEKRIAQPKTKTVAAPADGRFEIVHRRWLLVLAALSFVLSLPLFAPWSVWPLGYIVFVPWLLGVCAGRRSGWVYFTSYLLGCAFFFTHWRWLYDTTAEGYIAGSLAFPLFFVLAAWPVRHLYRKRHWNVAVVFAFVWTMIEWMRSHGPLAFPWFLLGHSQIRLLSLVQIADITGVLGISFMVALVNGWIVDWLLYRWSTRRGEMAKRRLVGTAVFTLIVMTTICGYGLYRLNTMSFMDGPKVAVLQGDFLLSPIDDPNAPTDEKKQATYLNLMEQAVGQAEMIVLPETPWPFYMNRELRELSAPQLQEVPEKERRWITLFMREAHYWHNRFLEFAQKHRVYLVTGGMSEEPHGKNADPWIDRYNSAFVYSPDGGEPDRYDKIHLVLFGEYVPFRYTPWLHSFYLWLNSITPWGAGGFEYSLTIGKEFKVFPMQSAKDGPVRHFGVTICYEDVIPQVFRRFIMDGHGRKQVDFMLNISNDGWFGHSDQQPQHLVNCAFRAIENRVGIARAVNTGVSGFIRPDGSWYSLVADSNSVPLAGGNGLQTARMAISPQVTFYSRFGDVFGAACAMVGLCAIIDALKCGLRRRSRKEVAA